MGEIVRPEERADMLHDRHVDHRSFSIQDKSPGSLGNAGDSILQATVREPGVRLMLHIGGRSVMCLVSTLWREPMMKLSYDFMIFLVKVKI